MRIAKWALLFLFCVTPLQAQFYLRESDNLRLLYFGQAQSYLVDHVARTFENALKLYRDQFQYEPDGKMSVLVYDIKDYLNGAAGSIPKNNITTAVAPQRFVFETLPATERINYIMNHELAHIVTMDQAAGRDHLFRKIFMGKVMPTESNPISFGYAFLTSPRAMAPGWYLEGIAVFMETWRTGGSGRLFGGYDEMMFRTRIAENKALLDRLGLDAVGGKTDFRGMAIPYFYGTRFFGYLGLKYGPESLLQWVKRTSGSKAYFVSQFQKVFGLPIDAAWKDWGRWEKEFQQDNLKKIRENPTTDFRPITSQSIGGLSRAYFDSSTRELYLGVNYPGQVAHLAAMDIASGQLRKIADVKGPSLHNVTSLAYDPGTRTLFYTADNNDWRDLRSVGVDGKKSTTLIKDARVGDLVVHPVDGALWGVRHDNGFATLVRIPRPYRHWNQILTWPYGTSGFDLSMSPDGKSLALVLNRLSGQQSLAVMDVEALRQGQEKIKVISDFDDSTPSAFTFSPDGAYLYGSSYYSGVANIYRHHLASGKTEPVTNTETGMFCPIWIGAGSLLAFRYTDTGLIPVLLSDQPVDKINSIRFLGQSIVERHPSVKEWGSGSPTAKAGEPAFLHASRYRWIKDFKFDYGYPTLEGYKNTAAPGINFHLSDSLMLNRLDTTLSYSPAGQLLSRERIHWKSEFNHWEWKLKGAYNYSDFYDLFGPRKTSRKGLYVGGEYQKYLIFDEPNRYLDYTFYADYYRGLDKLPEYQNIDAGFDKMLSFGARLDYRFFRRSLGSVEDEKGYRVRLSFGSQMVDRNLYPRLTAHLDYGFQLPIPHSSVWIRNSVGKSYGKRQYPFANFYFGGFGNNWVDHLDEKRYRDYLRFPGREIDDVAGNHFDRFQLEWSLPPILLHGAGSPLFFLNWIKPSLFATALCVDFTDSAFRRSLLNTGGQVDFHTMAVSHYQFTFSAGLARAYEKGAPPTNGWMVSMRIQ